jgi:hypothetical protein
MIIKKYEKEVLFRTKILVGYFYLLGYKPKFKEDRAFIISKRKEMSMNKFHRMLGHLSVDYTKQTGNQIRLKLKGKLDEY